MISIGSIPRLLTTPEGRRRLRRGVRYVLEPLSLPIGGIYRRTALRGTRMVAVVGSFGKTTTRGVIAAALNDQARGRGQYLTGAIFATRRGTPHAVFEVAIEEPGQMAPMARALRPDITVVTTVGSEHNKSLLTLENTRHEKANMVRVLRRDGYAILNGDDPNVLWMASQTRAKVITYGTGEACDVRATGISLDWPRGITFTVHAGKETQPVSTRMPGLHYVYSFLAAAAVARIEGIGLDEFARRVAEVPPVPGRLEVRTLPNGAVLLCDYYKSGVETMHAALDSLAAIPAGRRIVVFGQITMPPRPERQAYVAVAQHIARVADRAYFLGCISRYQGPLTTAGMDRANLIDGTEFVAQLAARLASELRPGDVVLIKGRSEERLDRVALLLQGRTVGCTLISCRMRSPRCEGCQRLETGFVGIDVG